MKNLTEQKLQAFFEENGFHVHLFESDENGTCAEIETHTEGGVTMTIILAPFLAESFIQYVKDFDIGTEIDSNRHDKLYCRNFTLRQSLVDFEKFEKFLIKVKKDLVRTINPIKVKYPSQSEAVAIFQLSEALNSIYLGEAKETRKLLEKMQTMKQKRFNVVFGDNSPWAIYRNAKGRTSVIWSVEKAKKLGIN